MGAAGPRRTSGIVLSLALALAAGAAGAGPPRPGGFAATASLPVAPLAFAGGRLLVTTREESRLAVHEIDAAGLPRLAFEIRVGLEPVAVRMRPGRADEAWVVNALSDDVAVVDLARRAVVALIPVGDEPADVAFAESGAKAYVTLSGEDAVAVVDAERRALVGRVALPCAAPRSIAIARGGRFVVVASALSGNRTTILPAPAASGGGGDEDVGGPRVGRIVPDDHPRAFGTLPDADLVAVDVTRDRVVPRAVRGVGTVLFGLAIHPARGRLFVANTDARNLVRGVASLRGDAVRHRVTIVDRSRAGDRVRAADLHEGIDPGTLPNPEALAASLAEPGALALDPDGGRLFVAAFGANRVGVLSEDGEVLARIGSSLGGRGLGPRGLAYRPESGLLYVFNWIDSTISVVDPAAGEALAVVPAGAFDPVPRAVRAGRRLFHDATTASGNGLVSCGSCHFDGRSDGLAWDLSDPASPDERRPDGVLFESEKGPMATPPLENLAGTAPFHWRGDRGRIADFAGAFASLLGREAPPRADEMEALEAYLFSLRRGPNPALLPDRSLSRAAERGYASFTREGRFYQSRSCASCHALPFGTNGMIVLRTSLVVPGRMDLDVPALGPVREKASRAGRTGFGLGHDGSKRTLDQVIAAIPTLAGPIPDAERRDLASFVESFDTGLAPAVGRSFVLGGDGGGRRPLPAEAEFAALVAEAARAHADVVAHGVIDGEPRAFAHEWRTGGFRGPSEADEPIPFAEFVRLAAASRAILVVAATPPGEGTRFAVDRDGDLLLDGDEARHGADPLEPDTDGDGFEDGVETRAGSDPADPASAPRSLAAPRIESVSSESALPYGRARWVVRASGVERGAVLEVARPAERARANGTGSDGKLEPVEGGLRGGAARERTERFALVAVGEGLYATIADADPEAHSAPGSSFVIRNRSGAASEPYP